MRLLFVFDIGFDRGGPSVHLLQDVLRVALRQGHKVHVILKDTNGMDDVMPEEFKSNPLFTYDAIKWNNDTKAGFVKRYIEEVKYANLSGNRALSNGKFDSVFLQSNVITYFYMRHLKKLNCRIVYNVQDIFPYNLKLSGQLPLERITFPVFRKLQNMGYKMADSIITISDDMKQTLIDDGVDKNKIEVVYNWSYADTPIKYENIDADNVFDLHLDHNKFNVIYAGNIGKMQNVELIAKTAYRMKEDNSIHFYIIGDGANKDNVKGIIEGLDNVTLLPMQLSKYAESIYAQADMNVVPLMPGLIKTALPSKTATVLRVDKPVVFCIEENSNFAKLIYAFTSNSIAESNNVMSLEKIIKYNQTKNQQVSNLSLFNAYFLKKNAERYIQIIVDIL